MNGKAVTALIVVLLAGGGLAIALSGGGDTEDTAVPPGETVVTSQPMTQTEKQEEPEQEPEKTDEQQVEEVVGEYLEQSQDSETVECDLVVDDVCVQNESDIDLSAVEEFLGDLDVQDVQVNGDEAQAQLNRGGSFELKREEGSWKISGFEPPARPDGGGGVEAPSRPEAEKPDVPKPHGADGTGGAEAP